MAYFLTKRRRQQLLQALFEYISNPNQPLSVDFPQALVEEALINFARETLSKEIDSLEDVLKNKERLLKRIKAAQTQLEIPAGEIIPRPVRTMGRKAGGLKIGKRVSKRARVIDPEEFFKEVDEALERLRKETRVGKAIKKTVVQIETSLQEKLEAYLNSQPGFQAELTKTGTTIPKIARETSQKAIENLASTRDRNEVRQKIQIRLEEQGLLPKDAYEYAESATPSDIENVAHVVRASLYNERNKAYRRVYELIDEAVNKASLSVLQNQKVKERISRTVENLIIVANFSNLDEKAAAQEVRLILTKPLAILSTEEAGTIISLLAEEAAEFRDLAKLTQVWEKIPLELCGRAINFVIDEQSKEAARKIREFLIINVFGGTLPRFYETKATELAEGVVELLKKKAKLRTGFYLPNLPKVLQEALWESLETKNYGEDFSDDLKKGLEKIKEETIPPALVASLKDLYTSITPEKGILEKVSEIVRRTKTQMEISDEEIKYWQKRLIEDYKTEEVKEGFRHPIGTAWDASGGPLTFYRRVFRPAADINLFNFVKGKALLYFLDLFGLVSPRAFKESVFYFLSKDPKKTKEALKFVQDFEANQIAKTPEMLEQYEFNKRFEMTAVFADKIREKLPRPLCWGMEKLLQFQRKKILVGLTPSQLLGIFVKAAPSSLKLLTEQSTRYVGGKLINVGLNAAGLLAIDPLTGEAYFKFGLKAARKKIKQGAYELVGKISAKIFGREIALLGRLLNLANPLKKVVQAAKASFVGAGLFALAILGKLGAAAAIGAFFGGFAGGVFLAIKGAALGASIGSVVPVVGTVVGGIVGGVLGLILGILLGGTLGAILGKIIETIFGAVHSLVGGVGNLLTSASTFFQGLSNVSLTGLAGPTVVGSAGASIGLTLFNAAFVPYLPPPESDTTSPYIQLTKIASPEKIENSQLPASLDYTIIIGATDKNLVNVRIKDEFSVYKTGTNLSISPPTPPSSKEIGEILVGESYNDYHYSLVFGPEFTDSLVVNTITVTADIVDGPQNEQTAVSCKVQIGKLVTGCFVFDEFWTNPNEKSLETSAINQLLASSNYTQKLCSAGPITLKRIYTDMGPEEKCSHLSSPSEIEIYNCGLINFPNTLYNLTKETGLLFIYRNSSIYSEFLDLEISAKDGFLCSHPLKQSIPDDFAETTAVYTTYKIRLYKTCGGKVDMPKDYPKHFEFARDKIFGGFAY
jgi:hypothetical protein